MAHGFVRGSADRGACGGGSEKWLCRVAVTQVWGWHVIQDTEVRMLWRDGEVVLWGLLISEGPWGTVMCILFPEGWGLGCCLFARVSAPCCCWPWSGHAVGHEQGQDIDYKGDFPDLILGWAPKAGEEWVAGGGRARGGGPKARRTWSRFLKEYFYLFIDSFVYSVS